MTHHDIQFDPEEMEQALYSYDAKLFKSLSHDQQIAYIGHRLAELPQQELPLTHHFSPGIYLREIFMPAGTVVIGKIHKTEHFNIILAGACLIVHGDGRREELRAPYTFVSQAGVQKVLYILEDCLWQTVHANPAEERDVELLEEQLTFPLPADPLELLSQQQKELLT